MDPATIKETHVPLPHIPANLLLTPGGYTVVHTKLTVQLLATFAYCSGILQPGGNG